MIKTYEAEALDERPAAAHRMAFACWARSARFVSSHAFPRDGTYALRVGACGQQAGPEPVTHGPDTRRQGPQAVRGQGRRGQSADLRSSPPRRRGQAHVAASFLNDYYKPDDPDPKRRDRNLAVSRAWKSRARSITRRCVAGKPPQDHLPDARRSRKSTRLCHGGDRDNSPRRAYRRPVTGGEVARLLRFVDLARENGETLRARDPARRAGRYWSRPSSFSASS